MDQESDEPMQRTPEGAERERLDLPGEGGTEIPLPTREQVYADLARVAKPRRRSREDDTERPS